MKIYQGWKNLPAEARGATIALGNFDGVHLGHAHLLRAAHAARPDAPLAVLTFEPHPREYFRPEDPPFRLTPLRVLRGHLPVHLRALGNPGGCAGGHEHRLTGHCRCRCGRDGAVGLRL